MLMKSCLIAFGAALALATPTLAEAPAAPGAAAMKLGQACKTDIPTLCAGVEGKGGARARCLRANQAKLSADCAKLVASKPAKWGQPLATTTPAPEKK